MANQPGLHLTSYTFHKSGFLLFKNLFTDQFTLDILWIISIGVILNADLLIRNITDQQKLNFMLLLTIILFLIKFISSILIFFYWIADVYEIRHKEFIHRYGVLRVVKENLAMEIIESITYDQTLMGKIFGYATLYVSMRHSDREPIVTKEIDHIHNHLTIVEILENDMQKELDHVQTIPQQQSES